MEAPGGREGDDAEVVARSAMGTAFYLFSHQAGGHKPFLRSAKGEVCKPAIPLELQFYQALDTRFPQLKPFVPPFVGVITVDLHPMAPAVATTTTAATDPTASEMPSRADEEPLADNGRLREPNNTTLHLQPEDGAAAALLAHSPSGKKRRLDTTRLSSRPSGLSLAGPTRSFMSTASYSATLWNKERPWADSSGSMRQSQCRQSRASAAGVTTREYLVLGDLTHAYSRPCVLDIKMGSRQHGEDAPPAKAASHSAKCAATTSLALGLRLCGMQVYDEVEQRYILWDKHWGRQLRQDGIEPALRKVR
jgi:inositol-hexakisphosphate 5-kinase